MAKVIVTHCGYGCDTGCCGHIVEVDGRQIGRFSFDHPDGDNHREFAEELIREAGCDPADMDWDNCIVLED